MRIWSLGAAAALAFVVGGCGIFADTISDELELDFDTDVIEPSDIGANVTQPLTFSVQANQDNPTYAFPAGVQTIEYSASLYADLVLGTDDFQITADGFTFSSDGDDPVEFGVLVRSAEDQYIGQDFGYVPTQPASCTFSLNPATDGAAEYGAAMTSCIRDFADDNGVPVNLTYTVNTRSLTNTKAPGDYSLEHIEQMSSKVEESSGVERKWLDEIDSDVTGNLDFASFTELTMAGYGFSSETVELTGVVVVHDAFGAVRAFGSIRQTIQGGEIYSIFTRYSGFDDKFENGDYSYAGNSTPTLVPGSPDFERSVLSAAATNLSLPTGAFGAQAIAWWNVKGGFPRVGEIGIKVVGTANATIADDPIPVPEGGEYVRWDEDNGFTFIDGN